MLRCALHEEGQYFPRIDSIEHALRLKKNPNLRAFREQLGLFHTFLSKGDREAIRKLSAEVQKALRAMNRIDNWNVALKWVTYFSLPVSVVESVLIGAPIAGTTLALFSTATTTMVDTVKRKNKWVLFGR